MRCLLDTHVFLWLAAADERLPAGCVELFEDTKNDFVLSRASVWEMAIKQSLGRLKLGRSLAGLIELAIEEQGLGLLGIELAHVAHVASLPFHHHDPFDRLLVAQALIEGLPLLSDKPVFDDYGVLRIWPA
ncbi:MAG: type II toxin-antitoxin system VapC family toxin [Deltaproteobacteria bacterium]|jgi:PIN domain nuclease of toxin-antitoxin system|nr:type II toxin-antitoxin system VapC family toxin [Deltaproteobacteria bacterium]MBW2530847.1 type II toxin-antitoxin system VapC family toxin [Deltaproteobacteria bacterium]